MQFSERDKRVLGVLIAAKRGLSLDTIAARLGYRPARSGRLAVLKTCRSILSRGKYVCSQYGEENEVIGRLPPKDQWGTERWFACDAAAQIIQR